MIIIITIIIMIIIIIITTIGSSYWFGSSSFWFGGGCFWLDGSRTITFSFSYFWIIKFDGILGLVVLFTDQIFHSRSQFSYHLCFGFWHGFILSQLVSDL